jgi:hypothetical protein
MATIRVAAKAAETSPVGADVVLGVKTSTGADKTFSFTTIATFVKTFIGSATTIVSGLMSAADKLKLDGVATAATANSSDATLLARANHTGTQLSTTISDFSPVSNKSALYTVVATDGTINCTSGTFTVTLLTAVGVTKPYKVKNSGTGLITIATTSAQTIDGQASGAITLNQYDSLTVESDGANWIIT